MAKNEWHFLLPVASKMAIFHGHLFNYWEICTCDGYAHALIVIRDWKYELVIDKCGYFECTNGNDEPHC